MILPPHCDEADYQEAFMNARILLIATGLLLVLPLSAARAQVKTPITVVDLFDSAKPGQWVRLEGMPQEDQSIQCSKAKVLTGAIQEDDWALKGQVRSVDAASRRLRIGRYAVRLQDTAKFKSPTNTLRSLSDVKLGMYVKVEGTFDEDGGFLARKLNDESADVAKKPGNERKISIQGKVDHVDANRKAIVLMGTTFVVSDNTQVSSVEY